MTWRIPILVVLSFCVAFAAHAQDAREFEGRYVGTGYVYNEKGELAKTDLRMDVRPRDDGTYNVEMGYFRDAVAKFASVKADGPSRLVVDEDVGGAPGGARATGQIVTEDGTNAAGTIEVRTTGETQKTLRTIRFHVRRLTEKTPRK
ncbi:MAG: hypothetical protein IT350_05445 [Deltaproteobacteria bacterium]|nr:hypothetical protein [Deltaproteobacteria bacterium]